MSLPWHLRYALALLVPASVISTVYLYAYPAFHGCAFPTPTPGTTATVTGAPNGAHSDGGMLAAVQKAVGRGGVEAPFRLLAFGDPQLEGDSSTPELLRRMRISLPALPDPFAFWPFSYDGLDDDDRDDGGGGDGGDGAGDGSDAPADTSHRRSRRRRQRWRRLWRRRMRRRRRGPLAEFDVVYPSPGALRKRLDLLGNDYYLAHIARALRWWTRPSHVAVLGDLLGSQWVSDAEFGRRAARFWRRVFRGAYRVRHARDDDDYGDGDAYDGYGHGCGGENEGGCGGAVLRRGGEGEGGRGERGGGAFEDEQLLGHDARWQRTLINVVGNHDVGYAGDMTQARMARFERAFGKANWAVRFRLAGDNDGNNNVTNRSSEASTYEARVAGEAQETATQSAASLPPPLSPELRLVVLNSLNLDGPALDPDLQQQTYDFVNGVIRSVRAADDDPDADGSAAAATTATILLTHVPLPKPPGVCADGPLVAYYDAAFGGGIREQNHLTPRAAASAILEGIFGMSADAQEREGREEEENEAVPNRGRGQPGIILTGHDHVGCDVYHHYGRRYPRRTAEATTASSTTVAAAGDAAASAASDTGAGSNHGDEAPTDTDTATSALSPPWPVTRWRDTDAAAIAGGRASAPGVREITVRSMMGDYGGHAALVSAWFDAGERRWHFAAASCALGVQHVWWAVHVLDLVTLGVGLAAALVAVFRKAAPAAPCAPAQAVLTVSQAKALPSSVETTKSPLLSSSSSASSSSSSTSSFVASSEAEPSSQSDSPPGLSS